MQLELIAGWDGASTTMSFAKGFFKPLPLLVQYSSTVVANHIFLSPDVLQRKNLLFHHGPQKSTSSGVGTRYFY